MLKNTESLAKNPDQTLQDQSFTRPSILILCPFRSFALKWFNALTAPGVLPESYSVFGRDRDRITKAFGLPEGAVDKLTEAPPGAWCLCLLLYLLADSLQVPTLLITSRHSLAMWTTSSA